VAGIKLPDEFRNWKVLELIVVTSIASLNVAVTVELIETPVAPLAGATDVIVGLVVSVDDPVVNVHEYVAARMLPAKS
jgi:hypothetical protein